MGCGGCSDYKNQKPNDNISEAIYEKIGEDAFYLGKEKVGENLDEILYKYLIKNYENETVEGEKNKISYGPKWEE